ncbi:MAG: alpha-hydroxy-acid oxidizing protein, partial [Armatimonadetes bacterium]|nr:alpha-hydroxy-acid oxidizing protein [Anaerolineae bacterium]
MDDVNLDDLINLTDFEKVAPGRITKMAYDYYASGANDQVTLHENHAAFDRLRLLPKMLTNVSQIDLTTSILGKPLTMPLMLAPTAFQRMAHPDGELATARAAARQGIGMGLSTIASTAMEDVAQAAFAENPQQQLWFQLYVYKDRGITRQLVARAEAAGYQALALTVDTPTFGRRYADVRNHFHL